MEKTTTIIAKDYYGDSCLDDRIQKGIKGGRKPEGLVEIYEEKEDGEQKLIHKDNLVLYNGREMLVQRSLNINNINITSTKDEFISWFGVGDGGVRPADPLIPIPPINTNNELSSPVMLNATIPTGYADYQTVTQVYTNEGYYKKGFDTVEFEADPLNNDRYLIAKLTITIGVNDANGEQLSEAGLYSAESAASGYDGNFSIYAKVTFPSLVKTSERRLIFVWYLFF